MPRIPRDVGGREFVRKLERYGYRMTRQTGSHVRLTRERDGEQHHVTVPMKKSLRVGTLSQILSDISESLGQEKSVTINELFG